MDAAQHTNFPVCVFFLSVLAMMFAATCLDSLVYSDRGLSSGHTCVLRQTSALLSMGPTICRDGGCPPGRREFLYRVSEVHVQVEVDEDQTFKGVDSFALM
eukprot:TRINITY_DN18195_c2_g1_i1.p1 TRINITY_DN18195_c2_g1~~TRINITY_DN18195_c2_g1_i1.p1  ORF type:complete len:101 (-),score=4.59 TRINITY_DN18195_c2_g1_i1:252-554(-)